MKIPKSTSRKHLLFLDVGIAHCGAVVYYPYTRTITLMKCFRTEAEKGKSRLQNNVARSRSLSYQLERICDDWKIETVYAEFPHGGAQNARAMSMMSLATAVVATLCAVKELTLVSIAPSEVKQLVRKKGKVTKEEIQAFVEEKFNVRLPNKKEIREHIADACACIAVAENFNAKNHHA